MSRKRTQVEKYVSSEDDEEVPVKRTKRPKKSNKVISQFLKISRLLDLFKLTKAQYFKGKCTKSKHSTANRRRS